MTKTEMVFFYERRDPPLVKFGQITDFPREKNGNKLRVWSEGTPLARQFGKKINISGVYLAAALSAAPKVPEFGPEIEGN